MRHESKPLLNGEPLISMAHAARMMPVRRGRRVHPSTLVRWAAKGVRGVKLEAVRLPSGWVTSAAAIERFARAYEEAIAGPGAMPGPAMTARRRAEIAEAQRRLAERLTPKRRL